MKLLIGMPMYNEGKDIEKHLNKLCKIFKDNYSLLIVNDGSTDNSADIVNKFTKKLRIRLIEHKVNKGLSATMNDIFYNASKNMHDGDILVTMDSDDTHDPGYITNIVYKITNGSNFVVVSRYKAGSKEIGYPKHKIFMSRFINTLLKILFPIKNLNDYTSGYRGIKGEIVKKLVKQYGNKINTSKGFAGSAEILLRSRKYGLKADEIPFIYRYDLKQGTSKLKLVETIKEYLQLIWKIKFKH